MDAILATLTAFVGANGRMLAASAAGAPPAVLMATAVLIARASRTRGSEAARHEARIAELARIQAETAGRIHTMGEMLTGRHAELSRVLADRLHPGTPPVCTPVA